MPGPGIYLTNQKSPCKECPLRRTYCHTDCQAYKDYRAAVEAAKEPPKAPMIRTYSRQIKIDKIYEQKRKRSK